MPSKREQEIVIRNGKPAAVILDIEDYQEMLERLEDLEDLKMLQEMRQKPLSFRKLDDFFDDIDKMVRAIKDLPAAPGCNDILLPGDPEYIMENDRKKNGIPLDEETWQGLRALAERLGVEPPKPFDDVRG